MAKRKPKKSQPLWTDMHAYSLDLAGLPYDMKRAYLVESDGPGRGGKWVWTRVDPCGYVQRRYLSFAYGPWVLP